MSHARTFTWLLLSSAVAYAGCSSDPLADGGPGGDGAGGGSDSGSGNDATAGDTGGDGGGNDTGSGDSAFIDGGDSTVNIVDGGGSDGGGSGDGAAFVDGGDGGDGSSGNDATVVNDGATDAACDGGKSDVTFSFDTGIVDDGSFNPDAACVNTSVIAEPAKLDLYFMFDKSTSMKEPTWTHDNVDPLRPWDCNIGQSVPDKWCRAINSLSQYLNSPTAAGNSAALQYFKVHDNAGCTGDEYATPSVPSTKTFTTLPSNAFDTSLNAEYPATNTPTIAAVRGLAKVAADPIYHRVGRKLVNILITDGDPNGCNIDLVWPHTGDIPYIQGELQAIYASYNVQTYVIGMTGATYANLETMASGGNGAVHNNVIGSITNACGTGTSTCRHWNVGDGNNNALLEALNLIQKLAISCSYAIPTSDAGLVDTAKIQVEYVPGTDAGAPQTLTKVSGVAACLADGGTGGWYYDNNANPTSINLCATTCQSIENDIAGKIRLLLGCQGS